MNKAYIFGCSHAAGSEMFENDIDREYTHSYPALIAKDLGYEIRNHAIPGGSNDAIFRILLEIYQDIDQQDLVIFCWTGAGRVEIFCESDQQWLQFSVGADNFYVVAPHPVALQGYCTGAHIQDHDGWKSYRDIWQQRWLAIQDCNEKAQEFRNMLSAHALANMRTKKIINLRSFGSHDHPYRNITNSFYWPIGDSEFWNWCHGRGFRCTPWGHFNFQAHRDFANFVLKALPSDYYPQQ